MGDQLLSLSYCAIKNPAHRTLAADITLAKMIKITNESLNILNSQIIKKKIMINVSDRKGCDITFELYTQLGKIIYYCFIKNVPFYVLYTLLI